MANETYRIVAVMEDGREVVYMTGMVLGWAERKAKRLNCFAGINTRIEPEFETEDSESAREVINGILEGSQG